MLSFLSKRRASDGLPLPPKRLNFLVTGAEDENWFMEGGLLGKRCVLEALERNRIQLASDSAALDFGCGCGRVLRHFKDFSWRLFGCDWNARLVRWNRRHLPFAQFAQNGLAPPLPYPDQSFHLIYAFSVFTHLSETLQHAWKSELRRVLKPGGTLILTTHGEELRNSVLNQAEQATFDADLIAIRSENRSGENACAAFQSEACTRQLFHDAFEPIEFVPSGAIGNPGQDLNVFRAI